MVMHHTPRPQTEHSILWQDSLESLQPCRLPECHQTFFFLSKQHFSGVVPALCSYVTLATIQIMSLRAPAARLTKSQESVVLIVSVPERTVLIVSVRTSGLLSQSCSFPHLLRTPRIPQLAPETAAHGPDKNKTKHLRGWPCFVFIGKGILKGI